MSMKNNVSINGCGGVDENALSRLVVSDGYTFYGVI